MNAGELAFIELDAPTGRTWINPIALQLREPASIQNLFRATRAQSWLGEFHFLQRIAPDGVQVGCGTGIDAIEFPRIEPDATAAAVANIHGHAARALLAQRPFAGRTF